MDDSSILYLNVGNIRVQFMMHGRIWKRVSRTDYKER